MAVFVSARLVHHCSYTGRSAGIHGWVLWPTYWTCPAWCQRRSVPAVMHHGPIRLLHLAIITYFSWPRQERINLISVRCVIVDFYIYKIVKIKHSHSCLMSFNEKEYLILYIVCVIFLRQAKCFLNLHFGSPPKFTTYLAPAFSPLISQWSVVISCLVILPPPSVIQWPSLVTSVVITWSSLVLKSHTPPVIQMAIFCLE